LVLKYGDLKETFNDKQIRVTNKFANFDNAIDHCPKKKDEIFENIKLILYNGKTTIFSSSRIK
jgi:coenzyme F420-reducing hydrogenase gamma subunit